jgi:hypothetical protein
MKTTLKHACIAIAALVISPLTHAGFVLEKPADVAPVSPPVATDDTHGRFAVTNTMNVRNVNPSASGDRISKMNRQRIDLNSRLTARITQSGNSPTELQSLRGVGNGVTFDDALREVLPAGWNVFSDQEAPLDAKVDWSGGRSWPMVINSLLTQLDMRAHIDWDSQELMLFVPAPKLVAKAEYVAPAASAVAPTEDVAAATAVEKIPAATQVVNSIAPTPVVVAKAPPVVVEKPVVWTVKPGNLREDLRQLADQAGWTLVWNATIGDMTVNYDVEAPGYQFTGSLVGSDGVIAKVIDLYAQAEHPLAVTFFHGNKVIEVRLHDVPGAKQTAQADDNVRPARQPAPPAPVAPAVEARAAIGDR